MSDILNASPKRPGPGRGLLLGLALGLVAGGTAVWLLRPRPAPAPTGAPSKKAYQCPMHPQILQDHPGTCPICGMDLVEMEGAATPQSPGPEGMVTVAISPERQQLMGLRTAPVEEGTWGGEIRSPGRVAVDERRVQRIAVRSEGYVEELRADFLGRPFRKGELLFSLNSPDFGAAQREFLAALSARRKYQDTEQGANYAALVETSRRRLAFLGASPAFIADLETSGMVTRLLPVVAPVDGVLTAKTINAGSKVAAMDQPLELTDLSSVWVVAELYESDLGRVRVGMPAAFSSPALGERQLSGKVAFLDPALDPRTRTLKARLELPNPGQLLRPDMLGEVVIQVPGKKGLKVPADAVLDSGTRSIVFVDVGQGYFEPREVRSGLRSSDSVEIVDGLAKGEKVVTRANFLVDSESRLKAALADMGRKSAPPDPHKH
ncbi:MAG: efflux RND transporter periplasmic adaptor subunit [Acidobacteria bacterium]|nr:efflux RND transporter periplasmic adaptor subunit [Acidobacteriota bacterium]